LDKIPASENLDLASALSHVTKPRAGAATYPFRQDRGSDKKPEGKQKKGTGKGAEIKYCDNNIPKKIQILLRGSVPVSAPELGQKGLNTYLKLCSNALSLSTWRKYASAASLFEQFCSDTGTKFSLPIPEPAITAFIVWNAENKKVSADSLEAYLTALSSLSKMSGGVETVSPRRKMLLRGFSNMERTKVSAQQNKDPVTGDVLKELCRQIKKKSWLPASKATVTAFCCAAYFGSFRAGELLAKRDNGFDPAADLLWDDITVEESTSGEADTITVRIKSPKVPSRRCETVELFRFGHEKFCPVKAVLNLMKEQKICGIFDPKQPVFRFRSGKNLTVSGMSAILKGFTKKGKLAGRRITASSFRSGVPSDMEGRPDLFSDLHIKGWGRWESGAYRRYMKCAHARKREIFARLSQLLS